ncbi:hypothetical protein GCM10010245_15400 [Streptomyces spectabilis]|nr:hypothetical protein GCM10010245_15400 [Streptomyces spectabilis]
MLPWLVLVLVLVLVLGRAPGLESRRGQVVLLRRPLVPGQVQGRRGRWGRGL